MAPARRRFPEGAALTDMVAGHYEGHCWAFTAATRAARRAASTWAGTWTRPATEAHLRRRVLTARDPAEVLALLPDGPGALCAERTRHEPRPPPASLGPRCPFRR